MYFKYLIQHFFLCRPSDPTVSEGAGIEPRTVASLALAVSVSSGHLINKLGYISRLSQWEEGRIFTCSNDFYLPSRRLEEGGRGQHPVERTSTSFRRVPATVQYILGGIIQ